MHCIETNSLDVRIIYRIGVHLRYSESQKKNHLGMTTLYFTDSKSFQVFSEIYWRQPRVTEV